jgi:hypothetical protein
MINGHHHLKRYLQDTLGTIVELAPWEDSKKTPFFLRNLYSFLKVQVLETPCLLMLDRNETEQSPATIRKHRDQVQAAWDGDIVYVRERVTAYNRKRLIEHKLPFVVPGNQMYLPMLGIDLREHFKKLRAEIDFFSPSTQALVFHLLLRETGERKFTPAEMAHCLGYSAMTMSRAFDNLQSAGLGKIMTEGRKRCLRFAESRKEIWESALPLLRTPVKKRFHIEPPHTDPPGPRAGLTALAHYTMLAEPTNPVFALTSQDWKSLRQRQQVTEFPTREPGLLEIEVWSYAPNLFSANGVVDPLSLYLSLDENRDERVEAALEEMMLEVAW